MSKITTLISRGNFIESSHNIKCYLGSIKNQQILSTDNENDIFYPRSSIKIFQGIPFASSKAIDLFSLNKKQVALSCSSHQGEKFHVKELTNWLKKTKLKSSDLKCGIHNPIDEKSSEEIFRTNLKSFQVHNNCAGKHLAMLSSCLVNNYPIRNYLDFDHPHQKNIRSIFSKFTESKIIKKNYGIDGCSAPQYAFKTKDLITALKNLFNSYHGNFGYAKHIKFVINSILANPLFIGGTKSLDSNLIKISNKKIFCKGGAEGVFLFVHLKKGIFGILKVVDGNARALPSVLYTLCKKFKILNKEELETFNSFNNLNLYNHAKVKVGHIRTKIE
jgi:L-asparaginase II